MPHPKKKAVHRVTKIPEESISMLENKELFVLDHATTCVDWYRLWSSFGFSQHQWLSRAAKVEEYTRKVIDDKLLTYKEQLAKRRKLLKQSLEDYEDLIARTGLPSALETLSFDELKLKEQEIYVEKKMQELLVNEGQLIHRRAELDTKQQHLCTLLNAAPIEFDEDAPISLMTILQKMQDHIQILTELKELRLAQVSSYYLKLKDYSEQLEWTPVSPISPVEYLLLEKFDRCLTADCLNEIEATMRELESRVESQRARFLSLHAQLGHLYARLDKDPQRDFCLAYKTGEEHINAFAIKQLEHEIACCREERMRNGKEYCHSIRQQIADLLEKARLGGEDRVVLDKLDFESLTPDLLDAYDAEFERVSQLYEERKPILDAYEKWLTFWNEFVAFTKASTDPGRFHIRGYNAEAEGRKRKKFHRELPLIEQEFLNALSGENTERPFLIDNVPIRQKFDDAHHQVPSTAMPPPSTPAKTPSRALGHTPIQPRTPGATPRRLQTKEPFVLGTAVTSLARRIAKTPSAATGRKLLNKVASHTEGQPIRAKPRAVAPPPPPPPPTPAVMQSSPPPPIATLPVYPPARTGDQSLDFSLLHTMKNIHGHMKVMTSTPNSSFSAVKTAHNIIGRRKSKRRSKRIHAPLLMVPQTSDDETVVCL